MGVRPGLTMEGHAQRPAGCRNQTFGLRGGTLHFARWCLPWPTAETLAREVDREGGDRLERARTWRYAGLAYADVAAGLEGAELVDKLTKAALSFQKADELLKGLTDPIERMKLDFGYVA
jgi:hypothetical protein